MSLSSDEGSSGYRLPSTAVGTTPTRQIRTSTSPPFRRPKPEVSLEVHRRGRPVVRLQASGFSRGSGFPTLGRIGSHEIGRGVPGAVGTTNTGKTGKTEAGPTGVGNRRKGQPTAAGEKAQTSFLPRLISVIGNPTSPTLGESPRSSALRGRSRVNLVIHLRLIFGQEAAPTVRCHRIVRDVPSLQKSPGISFLPLWRGRLPALGKVCQWKLLHLRLRFPTLDWVVVRL